jgi:hypothetical protein
LPIIVEAPVLPTAPTLVNIAKLARLLMLGVWAKINVGKSNEMAKAITEKGLRILI